MKTDNQILIHIESNKGTEYITTYRGYLEIEIYESIISNRLKSGFITLSNVYWIEEKYNEDNELNKVVITRLGKDGIFKGHKGQIHLKVEHIVVIHPLKETDIQELKKFNKKKC